MALEQQLTETLTQAIKAKDARTADVVRMIKSRLGERRTAKGFSGTVDDALVRERLDALKIADAKQVGRLVGDVMKTHKGQVDAAEVKRIAEELLKSRASP